MALTTLTVFGYGNVDALHGIFNAIAMITNANDFGGMIRLGMVIGFLVAATMAMVPHNFWRGPRWFITIFVFTAVTIGPKADVQIVDHLGQQPSVAVSNVPYALALIASVKTAVGSTLTQAFETAFQTIPDPTGRIVLDSELSYIEHGFMFGARAVRMSREADFSTLYTQGDTYNFLRNCIFPSQGRDNLADQIENSTDLKTLFANPNPALSSAYHDPAQNYTLVFDTCDNVYTALLPLLNREGTLAVARAAKRSFPNLPQAVAEQKIEASMMAIYNKGAIAGASTTAAEIMLQNILINATAEASALQEASLNDPSLIMFSSMRSQAVQSMNAGNLVSGRLAEEALPMIRNAIDGILYAVWPIICILAMMSEGPALAAMLKGYLLTLAWVEMWPPIFAVVNYLQTLEAAKHLAAAGLTQTSSGMTLATATGIYSSAVSDVAVAAYMVTMVPVLAAAVVWGMEKVTSIAGAAIGTRQAQQEATSGSKGNLSAGNVSLEQQTLAENLVQPGMATRTGIGGTEIVNPLTGERISRQNSSSFIVTTQDVQSIGTQQTEAATRATTLAQSSQKAYASASEAAMSEALSFAKSAGSGATRSLSFDVGKVGADGLSAEEKTATSTALNQQFKVGDVSYVSKALELGLSGNGNASAANRAKSIAGTLTSLLGGRASSVDTENLAKEIVSASDAMRAKGDQRRHELTQQVRTGDAFEEARRSNREGAERVESSFRRSETWRETATADLTKADSAQEDARKTRAASRTVGIDWSNLIDREIARRGLSVVDTVGDPLKMQQLVRDIIRGGSVFRYDADELWSPDAETTPHNIYPGINRSQLSTDYTTATPGRGAQGISDQHLVNDAPVRAKQAAAGVSSDRTVSGSDVQKQVAAGMAARDAEINATQAANRQSAGEKQLDYDKRAETVSDLHRPLIKENPVTHERLPNRALEGVQGTDGSNKKPFADEAADAKREEARREQQLGKPGREIPK